MSSTRHTLLSPSIFVRESDSFRFADLYGSGPRPPHGNAALRACPVQDINVDFEESLLPQALISAESDLEVPPAEGLENASQPDGLISNEMNELRFHLASSMALLYTPVSGHHSCVAQLLNPVDLLELQSVVLAMLGIFQEQLSKRSQS